jgi:hypothetical protein
VDVAGRRLGHTTPGRGRPAVLPGAADRAFVVGSHQP